MERSTEGSDPVRSKKRIWTFIALYILLIYATLPVMRTALNFIYSAIGRANLGYLVNAALIITSAGIVAFLIKKKCVKTLFLVLVPMIITLIFIFMLEVPEERVHFIQYGFLGVLVLKASGDDYNLRRVLLSILFVAIVGAMDEFIQMLLPNRVGDLRDVMMNASGGALGVWIRKFWC